MNALSGRVNGSGAVSPYRRLMQRIYASRYYYLILLPGMIYILLFQYEPMYGLLLAFKKYNASLGILHSPWVGLAQFRRLMSNPDFFLALRNTLEISLSRLVIEFAPPILLSIMLNELYLKKTKRILQTVFTFPYFMSWIIVGSILVTFFGQSGAVNGIIASLGGQKVDFLADVNTFRPMLYLTSIWKNAGWSSIIYIAAIAGINPELYEACIIDGGNRFHRIWHIMLPGIQPTIVVLFILSVGGIMNAGFDQIFNLTNPAVTPISDIIDTYVYRITFLATPDFGFSTAVGLFKSVINLIMLLLANRIVKAVSGSGLFQ